MEIDKINVGMYVRTLNGIVKIDKIQNDVMKDTKGCLHYGDFIKARHNIIDLIEVGDYVNGYKITKVENKDGKTIIYRDYDSDYYFSIEEEDIKSIVTKEQFESMSYKVGKIDVNIQDLAKAVNYLLEKESDK